jgi:hypothetical protein
MSLSLALVWISYMPALSQVPNKDVRREFPLSLSLLLTILMNVYRIASLVSRIRYARPFTVLLSVLRRVLTTGEYVFDFAMVVFGVRILFCSFFFLSVAGLVDFVRALTLSTCCTTAIELF